VDELDFCGFKCQSYQLLSPVVTWTCGGTQVEQSTKDMVFQSVGNGACVRYLQYTVPYCIPKKDPFWIGPTSRVYFIEDLFFQERNHLAPKLEAFFPCQMFLSARGSRCFRKLSFRRIGLRSFGHSFDGEDDDYLDDLEDPPREEDENASDEEFDEELIRVEPDETVFIDGRMGEGGGQLVRNSIALGNIMRKRVLIRYIRGKRVDKGGMLPHHIQAVQLATSICGGDLIGDEYKSPSLSYAPEDLPEASKSRAFNCRGKTAQPTMLPLQAALPCILLGPSATDCRVSISGTTNQTNSPDFEYVDHVLLPTLRMHCGVENVQLTKKRPGYFPLGKGEIECQASPLLAPLKPIKLVEQGEISRIYIRSYKHGNLHLGMAQAMAKGAHYILEQKYRGVQIDVETAYEKDGLGSSLGVFCMAVTSSGCRLASCAISEPRRETRAKWYGKQAAYELIRYINHGACADPYLSDQLILYMALAKGLSEVRTVGLTLHVVTAIAVAKELTGAHFEITRIDPDGEKPIKRPRFKKASGKFSTGRKTLEGQYAIRCWGIGFMPNRTKDSKQPNEPTSSETEEKDPIALREKLLRALDESALKT
jgi:RNA 3'-terminal phosphate cyclase (ATP)